MRDSDSVAAEKARLRERFQAARLALPADLRASASRAICDHILALPEIAVLGGAARPPAAIGLFWPRLDRAEVDVTPLTAALHDLGIAAALPRVAGPGEIAWHRCAPGDLVAGRWGLMEPPPGAPSVSPEELALVVVPGLAFGADGARLGWGGGFYDRALARTDAVAVGVTFAGALAESLPTDGHDAHMDAVVTERGVLRPGA